MNKKMAQRRLQASAEAGKAMPMPGGGRRATLAIRCCLAIAASDVGSVAPTTAQAASTKRGTAFLDRKALREVASSYISEIKTTKEGSGTKVKTTKKATQEQTEVDECARRDGEYADGPLASATCLALDGVIRTRVLPSCETPALHKCVPYCSKLKGVMQTTDKVPPDWVKTYSTTDCNGECGEHDGKCILSRTCYEPMFTQSWVDVYACLGKDGNWRSK